MRRAQHCTVVLWHEDKCVCCRMQIKAILWCCFEKTSYSASLCLLWADADPGKNHPGCSWSLNKNSVQFHCFSWCLLLNRPDGPLTWFSGLYQTGCWIDPVSRLWSIWFPLSQLTSVALCCWHESIRANWRMRLPPIGESQASKTFGRSAGR